MIMTSWPKKKISDWLRQRVCLLMIMINWPSKYLVLARCVVFIRFDYTLIAEDSLWFLFWSHKKRVRERKKKKKKEAKNVRMIHFLSTCCWFKTTKSRRGSLRSGPKKERARERETRKGRGRACPEGPQKSFNSHSMSVDISNWLRGSRGKN